jgi:hypothetical protein
MGTTLVAGTGVTLTVSDPSDTITIAASGSSPWEYQFTTSAYLKSDVTDINIDSIANSDRECWWIIDPSSAGATMYTAVFQVSDTNGVETLMYARNTDEAGWLTSAYSDNGPSANAAAYGYIQAEDDDSFVEFDVHGFLGSSARGIIGLYAVALGDAAEEVFVNIEADYIMFRNGTTGTIPMSVAPDAAFLGAGANQFSIGFDDTSGSAKIDFKGRDSAGNIVTGSVALA